MAISEVLTALAFLEVLSKGGNAPAPAPAPLPASLPTPALTPPPPSTLPVPAVTPVVPMPPPLPAAVTPPPVVLPPAPTPAPTPFVMPPPGVVDNPVNPPPVDIGPAEDITPIPDTPPSPAAPPGTLPAMPPWGGDTPAPVPSALPPFPGPGWVSDTPVSAAVVARAQYWNPQLWNYATKSIVKPFVQEQFGGRWMTFAAAWHPGDQGAQTYMATEAWRLASAQPMPTPVVPTPGPTMPPAGVTTPPQVSPYPGPGAYQSNAAYITRYQTALTFLAAARKQGSWDPKGVDGKYGPNTSAAVKAFQTAHHLTPVDGECGAATAAAIDAELGYSVAPAPSPAPAPITPAVVVQPATPTTPAVLQQPAPVSPYPGPGAYQSNAAYIMRYQAALTFLAHAAGIAAWDPQGIDGKFGPNTQNAVKAFQSSHGLSPVDGECGAATAASLDTAVATVAASNAA